jgi:hypothetical protein
MNKLMRKLALGGLLALAAGAAAADVTVNYIAPERFSDLPFTPWERDEVLKNLSAHFAKLARQLPPGQHLRIDVQDIDLAGREYPARGARDVRIVKNGIDWPRIDLHFALEQDGQVVRSGDVKLRDMAYMDRSNRYFSGESLRYEKRMLDDWFYESIVPREQTARR